MNIIIRNLTNHSAEVTINGADYTITREGNVFGKCDNPITLRPDTSGYASFTAGKKENEQEWLYIDLLLNTSYLSLQTRI